MIFTDEISVVQPVIGAKLECPSDDQLFLLFILVFISLFQTVTSNRFLLYYLILAF